jgi:hypothetical protein
MIALMKDWPPKTCILNCPPLVLSRDYYRYVATKQPGK